MTVNATAEISVIENRKDLKSDATLYEVVDETDKRLKVGNVIALGKALNGKEILLNANNVSNIIIGADKLTASHEAGHTGGLQHPTQKSKDDFITNLPANNFMNPVYQQNHSGPTKRQIYRIYQLYSKDKLNKTEGTKPWYAEW